MRTTVRLNDALLKQAKREAARRNTTLTALIESGLRMALTTESPKPARIKLTVSKASGGVWPGIDITNSGELLDIMDGYVDPSRRKRIS